VGRGVPIFSLLAPGERRESREVILLPQGNKAEKEGGCRRNPLEESYARANPPMHRLDARVKVAMRSAKFDALANSGSNKMTSFSANLPCDIGLFSELF
jgi:hypothetical protein